MRLANFHDTGMARRCALVLPLLVAISCDAGRDASTDTAAAAPPAATPGTPATPALNDAQIAHVAVTANAIDSAMGELARPKARSASVRTFAETMIRDHARADLQGRSGAEFDRAYMDREVQYHQAVLDALDQTLIPGAQNADLKSLLQQARPNFAQHLALAQQTRQGLGQ
jgi:putative membrane protein